MSRDKQIDEMVKDLCDIDCKGMKCDSCDSYGCEYAMQAEALYNAGYRKSSDVARDIINDALSKIQIMISSLKQYEQTNIITEFNGGAKTALEIVFKDLVELKKKYTEGK